MYRQTHMSLRELPNARSPSPETKDAACWSPTIEFFRLCLQFQRNMYTGHPRACMFGGPRPLAGTRRGGGAGLATGRISLRAVVVWPILRVAMPLTPAV